ncbi:MAG: hypothetical protein K0M45_04140 [Candidatus Paracaedibacteraceae bacterium]|nr:hypothetical protein [Candidatus Paracaedibacteraceae bacterium]
MKIYNGIDEYVLNNEELLDLVLPIVKINFSISENYRHLNLKPIPCDILALSGDQDPTVSQEEMLVWEKHTTGKFEHVVFSGKHFFIKGYQKEILKIINQIGDNHTQM